VYCFVCSGDCPEINIVARIKWGVVIFSPQLAALETGPLFILERESAFGLRNGAAVPDLSNWRTGKHVVIGAGFAKAPVVVLTT